MNRLLFLLLLLLFAGCGLSAPVRPVAVTAPAATHTIAVPKPQGYVPDREIASRTATVDGEDLALAITHLDRAGATVALGLTLSGAHTFYAHVGRVFDDGEVQPIRGSRSRENGFSVDGVYLLDRAHAQKYLVARDPDGHCICDAGLAGAKLAAGSMRLAATYGAPPPDVTAVDVVVPHFGAFANVPLG